MEKQLREFGVTLNENEINLLVSVLMTTTGVPYQTMHPLLTKITAQINEQLQPKAEAPKQNPDAIRPQPKKVEIPT
jgi:hypothetical protein